MNDTRLAYLNAHLRPRNDLGHKNDFGRLHLLVGSAFYRGAAVLAASSALRCGVGLLQVASVEKVLEAVIATRPEAMLLPLAESQEGTVAFAGVKDVFTALTSCRALLCGCGMTAGRDTEKIVTFLLENADCPLILDADALNVLAGRTALLKCAHHIPILTPHVGEMARLSGLSAEEIRRDPVEVACRFAKEHRCVLILKDAETVVASPNGEVYVNSYRNSGLAKGGSGDVLAGMVASFKAQGYPPFEAAVLGVTLHSYAGTLAERESTAHAMLPSDLITQIPRAFSALIKKGN